MQNKGLGCKEKRVRCPRKQECRGKKREECNAEITIRIGQKSNGKKTVVLPCGKIMVYQVAIRKEAFKVTVTSVR